MKKELMEKELKRVLVLMDKLREQFRELGQKAFEIQETIKDEQRTFGHMFPSRATKLAHARQKVATAKYVKRLKRQRRREEKARKK